MDSATGGLVTMKTIYKSAASAVGLSIATACATVAAGVATSANAKSLTSGFAGSSLSTCPN